MTKLNHQFQKIIYRLIEHLEVRLLQICPVSTCGIKRAIPHSYENYDNFKEEIKNWVSVIASII
jgi:hypothetical protein